MAQRRKKLAREVSDQSGLDQEVAIASSSYQPRTEQSDLSECGGGVEIVAFKASSSEASQSCARSAISPSHRGQSTKCPPPGTSLNKAFNSTQIMARTGWSAPTLWRRYTHDDFPEPYYDGRFRIWNADEVERWLDAHPQCRATHADSQSSIDINALKQEIIAELGGVVAAEVQQAQAQMKSELRALFS